MPEELYIGIVGIRALQSSSILAKGEAAYTNLILFASNAEDYKTKAFDFFMQYGIQIFEYEDVESLEEREKEYDVSEHLLEIARQTAKDAKPRYSSMSFFDDSGE